MATLFFCPPERRQGAESRNAHGPQGPRHALVDLLGGEPHVGGAEGHVLADGGHEELVVGILKHQSHRLPDDGQRLAGDRYAAHVDATARGQQQPVGVEQQGRFSRAVHTYQSGLFAVPEGERHAPQGLVAVGIGVAHVVETQIVVAHDGKICFI